jgi:transposase InsO family protein
VKTLFIEPGSLWENGYVESFHGKLRDECLHGKVFEALLESQVLIERWRHDIGTQEERESTQRGLAARRSRNPLYAKRLFGPRGFDDVHMLAVS